MLSVVFLRPSREKQERERAAWKGTKQNKTKSVEKASKKRKKINRRSAAVCCEPKATWKPKAYMNRRGGGNGDETLEKTKKLLLIGDYLLQVRWGNKYILRVYRLFRYIISAFCSCIQGISADGRTQTKKKNKRKTKSWHLYGGGVKTTQKPQTPHALNATPSIESKKTKNKKRTGAQYFTLKKHIW